MKITKKIAVLAGDGIGPEVMQQALRVLEAVAVKYGHTFEFNQALIGGAAFDVYNDHCPQETLKIAESSDAVLFGAVGGPQNSKEDKWKDCEVNSILALRKHFSFNCNLRPAKVYPQLKNICPLKEHIAAGTDLLIVRELLGDIYFGEHSQSRINGKRTARDVAEYNEDQIASVAKFAFEAALKRRSKVTSVDKANVLATSKLWREVVREVQQDYLQVELDDMLVDNCAMQIVRHPSNFDVILTANLFGDILSDIAALLPGSLGLTPSASISSSGFGLYEPSGGSAPDIAGRGTANPVAQILCASMMLKYSFGLLKESLSIERAVELTFEAGYRTGDIAEPETVVLSTKDLTDKILQNLN